MGVFPADKGAVLVNGKSIDRDSIGIGYLPEERGLYPKKVILDQLIYFGMLKGLDKKKAAASAKYWLERLGMTEYTKRKLETLSKGNQQKIQLVVTLIANPQIVILDEPFSGLDPVNAMLLKDIVKELIAEGKIVLFSSHQMNYIEEFCNNIAILNGGRIVASGSIREIKRSYDRDKIIIVSDVIDMVRKHLQGIGHEFIKCITEVDSCSLMVQLQSAHDKERLWHELSDAKFRIDEFKVYEPSLNDIFVEYTEDRI